MVPPVKIDVGAIMARSISAGILGIEARENPYLPDGVMVVTDDNNIDIFDLNKGLHTHITKPEFPGLIKKFNEDNA